MKDSTRSSLFVIGIGVFLVVVGILIISLAITQWNLWILNLTPIGMAIIVGISVFLIIIGVILIIKFIT